jgi:hypothetical protein
MITTEMVNVWPCTTISRSGIIPIGRTELPLAIRNQNLHGSHLVMPSCRHVAMRMTFTPEPPSMRIPVIFCPPTIASMLGHSQSITRSSTSVSCTAGAGDVAVPSSVRRIPSRNRGTNRRSCCNVIVTCIPAKYEMSGSVLLPYGPAVSVSTALPVAAR